MESRSVKPLGEGCPCPGAYSLGAPWNLKARIGDLGQQRFCFGLKTFAHLLACLRAGKGGGTWARGLFVGIGIGRGHRASFHHRPLCFLQRANIALLTPVTALQSQQVSACPRATLCPNWFQSSPVPRPRCNMQLEQNRAYAKQFQSSPSSKARCNGHKYAECAYPEVFQSSPSSKARCNRFGVGKFDKKSSVSILTQLESQVQPQ